VVLHYVRQVSVYGGFVDAAQIRQLRAELGPRGDRQASRHRPEVGSELRRFLAHSAIADQASEIQLPLPAFTPLQDARNGGYPAFGTARIGRTTGKSRISATRKHREG
jgi:hypothetical protein